MEQRNVADAGLVTVDEAMKFLAMSRAKVYDLMDSGELPFGKYGKCRRIPRRALIEYAARGILTPADQP